MNIMFNETGSVERQALSLSDEFKSSLGNFR